MSPASGRTVPPAPPLMVYAGTDLEQLPVTEAEETMLMQSLDRLAFLQSQERDLSDLLLQDTDLFLYGLSVAKAQIGTDPIFKGTLAQGAELGLQLIRAITVMNPGITSGNPALTWIQNYASNGWTNIFGSQAQPVSLAQRGLGGNSATNEFDRVMLCFGSLINSVAIPMLAEYRFHVGQIDYDVHPITWQPAMDLQYARLFAKIVIPASTQFYMRGNIQSIGGASGQDGTQLLGIAFATGDYLTSET
jgi:hypothetical protein